MKYIDRFITENNELLSGLYTFTIILAILTVVSFLAGFLFMNRKKRLKSSYGKTDFSKEYLSYAGVFANKQNLKKDIKVQINNETNNSTEKEKGNVIEYYFEFEDEYKI